MKTHLDALIGVGWDQLYALMLIIGSVSAGLVSAVMFFLRYMLRSVFVTRADHVEAMRKQAQEHLDNLRRFKTLEEQQAELATKHNLKGVMQRQDSLSAQLSKLQTSQAGLEGQIGIAVESARRTEHLMGLVLDHMLERDKT